MLKTEDQEIKGRTFRVAQLPGTKSLRMFTAITKIVGPALGELAANEKELGKLLDQDVGQLGMAVVTLCSDLNPDEVERIALAFAAHSKVELEGEARGQWVDLSPTVFDDVFGGRIDRMFGWLAFCLQVNYSSFLAESRSETGPASSGTEAAK